MSPLINCDCCSPRANGVEVKNNSTIQTYDATQNERYVRNVERHKFEQELYLSLKSTFHFSFKTIYMLTESLCYCCCCPVISSFPLTRG